MKKSSIIYSISALILGIMLILFCDEVTHGAVSGFNTWQNFVMPSVFPFFVCVSLLRESGLLDSCNIWTILISSCLSSAPSGARICSEMSDRGIIDENNLSSVCALCNLVSPVFIIGTLHLICGTWAVVLPVFLGNYLPSFALSTLFSNKIHKQNAVHTAKKGPFFQTLCGAITDSTASCVKIGGVIVFFTVIIFILARIASIMHADVFSAFFGCMVSLIEITNGAAYLSACGLPFNALCGLLAFFVNFGGLCILMQSLVFCRINIKKYLTVKLFTASLSGIISFVVSFFMNYTEYTSYSLAQEISTVAVSFAGMGIIAFSSLVGCTLVWIMSVNQVRHL